MRIAHTYKAVAGDTISRYLHAAFNFSHHALFVAQPHRNTRHVVVPVLKALSIAGNVCAEITSPSFNCRVNAKKLLGITSSVPFAMSAKPVLDNDTHPSASLSATEASGKDTGMPAPPTEPTFWPIKTADALTS